jgi:caa(3)-type oxidase subunit IV
LWILLASEAMFFGGLLFAYAYGRLHYPEGFAAAGRATDVVLGTVNTALLLTGSFLVALAAASQTPARHVAPLLAATALLGLAFMVVGDRGLERAPQAAAVGTIAASRGRRALPALRRRGLDLSLPAPLPRVAPSMSTKRSSRRRERRTLLAVWLALLTLMLLSLGSTYLPLDAGNATAGPAIAALETSLVAWWFTTLRVALPAQRAAAPVAPCMLALLATLPGVDYATRRAEPAPAQPARQIAPLVQR